MNQEQVDEFENSILTQLRALGVVLYDDAGNRLHLGQEYRVVGVIARHLVQLVVLRDRCQTPAVGSTPDETSDDMCCAAEKRNMDGGCDSCGDPSL